MGWAQHLKMLFKAKYINLKTDSSSGKTALVFITLHNEPSQSVSGGGVWHRFV